MTEEWIRRSCFSQTLQTVELGYGPITAPSVSATRAGSLISACFRYLHWKKKKTKKKTVTDPSSQRSLTGPGSYKIHRAIYTYKEHKDRLSTTTSKLAHQCEAALTISVRGPPWKTNRGHSLLSTLLTPPSKHPWRQFQGPMCMKKNCGQAPPGRETRHKRGTYLTVVHLPHNTSKDRQHTAHSVLKACLCNTRKSLKKHALKGIHYLWYKRWPHGAGLIKHLGNAEYMCSGCWWFGLMA